MRKRPISKQKRMKATARRRFMKMNCLLSSLHFFDASGLAPECAHVIELCSADASGTDDLDLVDDLRVKREDAFHSMTERHLADRKCFARAAMLLRDTNPFEYLDALFIAFLDLHMNLDRIAGSECRDIRPELLFFDDI